jgi:hypothetical protein
VNGICEQRERAREQPTRRLDGHEPTGEQHGPEDPLLVVTRGRSGGRGVMVV